jgi:hypothetical protein
MFEFPPPLPPPPKRRTTEINGANRSPSTKNEWALEKNGIMLTLEKDRIMLTYTSLTKEEVCSKNHVNRVISLCAGYFPPPSPQKTVFTNEVVNWFFTS